MSFIVGDKATVNIHGAALFVLIVQENRAAGIFAVVVGDLAAVDVQHTLAVIQRDRAAAVAGNLTAGDLAAENVQRALVEIHAAAAPAFGCAPDRSASGAVAEDEPSAVVDRDLIRAVAGEGFSVQAEVERCAIHHQIAVEGDILRQIHIGSLIGVRNGIFAVPALVAYRRVSCMVACAYAAAADAMLVRRPMRVKRMRFSGSYNGARFNLSAAVLFGEPAVKIIPRTIGRGQFAVRTVISHFIGGIRKSAAVWVKGYIELGLRPAGVERMRFFCRNGGVCVHLSAAVLFGIPTVKMIAGTNWRGHFAVGTIMLYGLCLVASI